MYTLHATQKLRDRLSQLATLAATFEHVALIAPPDGPSGNHVLVASDTPISLRGVDPADGIAVTGQELDDFIGDVRALLDDYAPVDQLITRR